jgi:hypothetical protein
MPPNIIAPTRFVFSAKSVPADPFWALVPIDLRLKPQLSSAHLLVEVVNANVDFVSFNPDNSADCLSRNPVPLCQVLDRFARLIGCKNLAISHRCFLNH